MDSVENKPLPQARPFVKWAGGKNQLLPALSEHYPAALRKGHVHTYLEPMVGGGAVLFDVLQRFRVERAVICDVNGNLINTYRCIKEKVATLADRLEELEQSYLALEAQGRQERFYQLRERYNATTQLGETDVDRAVLFIFLNRTCFNGLYRVNRSGAFNVPVGRYKNPTICDRDNLLRVSALLQRVEIRQGGYQSCLEEAGENTFVYLDPPYRPLSATSAFTSYNENSFDDKAQRELAAFYCELDRRGAMAMLSNSDPKNSNPNDEFFDELYKEYTVRRVTAKRMINAKAAGRGSITEILVTNY